MDDVATNKTHMHANATRNRSELETLRAIQEAGRGATEESVTGWGSHLARANSPKYSVIANMSACHHKASSGALARKNSTVAKSTQH
jgi:hypothetical protein